MALPKSLLEKGLEGFGIATAERAGLEVRVTRLTRMLVDVLDRPDTSGGWEEI